MSIPTVDGSLWTPSMHITNAVYVTNFAEEQVASVDYDGLVLLTRYPIVQLKSVSLLFLIVPI